MFPRYSINVSDIYDPSSKQVFEGNGSPNSLLQRQYRKSTSSILDCSIGTAAAVLFFHILTAILSQFWLVEPKRQSVDGACLPFRPIEPCSEAQIICTGGLGVDSVMQTVLEGEAAPRWCVQRQQENSRADGAADPAASSSPPILHQNDLPSCLSNTESMLYGKILRREKLRREQIIKLTPRDLKDLGIPFGHALLISEHLLQVHLLGGAAP